MSDTQPKSGEAIADAAIASTKKEVEAGLKLLSNVRAQYKLTDHPALGPMTRRWLRTAKQREPLRDGRTVALETMRRLEQASSRPGVQRAAARSIDIIARVDMDNIDMSAKRWLVCIDCGTTMAAGCDCGSTYEPKQDMAVTALKRSPEKSDRAIAAEIGVSDRTVNRARATSVAPDDNPLGDKPERRLGKDGKMYTKPKRKKVAKGKKGKALKPGRMYPGEFEGCDAIAYPKTTDGDQVTFNLRYLASEANNFRRRAEEFKDLAGQAPRVRHVRGADAFIEQHAITSDGDI